MPYRQEDIDQKHNQLEKPSILPSVLYQQTGLQLKKDGKPLSEFTVMPDIKNKEFAPIDEAPLCLEVANKLQSLIGLSEIIQELKEQLLELNSLSDPQLKRSSNNLKINRQETKEILEHKKQFSKKYTQVKNRINLLLAAIESLDKTQQKSYQQIKIQLSNWQLMLEQLINNLGIEKTNQELSKQSAENEVQRLKMLLSGGRETNLEKGEKLKQRVIAILENNTNPNQKNTLKVDLINELFRTAMTINELRIIERFRKDGVDLLELRNFVLKSKLEYDQTNKAEEKAAIQQEVVNLLLSLANQVKDKFPHEKDSKSSLITSILYNNEAVCSGKAEILVMIAKFLGLKSSFTSVEEDIYSIIARHDICQVELFNKELLFLDANYHYKKGLQEEAFEPEELEKLRYWQDIAREKHPNTQVLVYVAQEVDPQEIEFQGTFELITSNGEKKVYLASVPYPHLLVVPEREMDISVDARLKAAIFFKKNLDLLIGSEKEKINNLMLLFQEIVKDGSNSPSILSSFVEFILNNRKNLEMDPLEIDHLVLKKLEEAIKLCPKNAVAYRNLAYTIYDRYSSFNLKKEEAAQKTKELLKTAIKADSYTLVDSLYSFADFLIVEEKNIKAALKIYQKALKIKQEYPRTQLGSITEEDLQQRITACEEHLRENSNLKE